MASVRHNYARRLLSAVLVVAFLLVMVSSLSAELAPMCPKCKNRGRVDTALPEDFKNLPFKSSAVIEYKTGCCGLGWIPCPRKECTKREESVKEFGELTAPLKLWVEERRRAVEGKAFAKEPKLKDVKALHAETAHFHFAGTLKKRTVKYLYKGMVKKKDYDPERSLHLYAERVEEVYKRFVKMMQIEGDYFPAMVDKWNLLVWEEKAQQGAASMAFCNFTNEAFASVEAVVYTTWDSDDDLYLHHKIANAISNLMTEDLGGVVEFFPVWLKEAIAHWVEYDIFNEIRIFTIGEVEFDANCPTTKLKSSIKKAIKRKDKNLRPLGDYMDKNIMDLKGWDRIKNWSIIDWLINGVGNNATCKLVKHFKVNYLRNNKQQGPTFTEVLSMNPDEIDEAWAAWALENYPEEEDD